LLLLFSRRRTGNKKTYQFIQHLDEVVSDSAAQAPIVQHQNLFIPRVEILTNRNEIAVDINLAKLRQIHCGEDGKCLKGKTEVRAYSCCPKKRTCLL